MTSVDTIDALETTTRRLHCFRCDYALVGIADDQPCPECGLLAGRSRRENDQLQNARPRWLNRMALGIWLMLSALALPLIVVAALQIFEHEYFQRNFYRTWRWTAATWRFTFSVIPVLGFAAGSLMFLAGVWLLTTAEGHDPADRADQRRRMTLRALSCVPTPVFALQAYFWQTVIFREPRFLEWAAPPLLALACVPLPLLLFLQLRSLAKRAGSAHLAEHCIIAGVGTSLTILWAIVESFLFQLVDLPNNRSRMGTFALLLRLLGGVTIALFTLWSVYLLIRFALSFARAARRRRHLWKVSDFAAPAGVGELR